MTRRAGRHQKARTGGRARDRHLTSTAMTAQHRWATGNQRVSWEPVVAYCEAWREESTPCRWRYGDEAPLPSEVVNEVAPGFPYAFVCPPNFQGLDAQHQVAEAIVKAQAWYHEMAYGHKVIIRRGRLNQRRRIRFDNRPKRGIA